MEILNHIIQMISNLGGLERESYRTLALEPVGERISRRFRASTCRRRSS